MLDHLGFGVTNLAESKTFFLKALQTQPPAASSALSPADLAQLNSGGTVTEVSSVTDAPTFGSHSHGVTVTCV
jgi:hypothetical protein